MRPPILSIAGFDSSGGAGISVDLETIAAAGGRPYGCVTALTVQDADGLAAAQVIDAPFFERQLRSTLAQARPVCAKSGMLAGAATVARLVSVMREATELELVCDPVLYASAGGRLLDDAGLARLRAELLPLCRVVTPNRRELEALAGCEVRSLAAAEAAARLLLERDGARAVLVTGGHFDGDRVVDLLVEGSALHRFDAARIVGGSQRGTGCMLSAALATQLGLGQPLAAAVERAGAFVRSVLRRRARGVEVG